jgi:hypothetical protein
VKYIAKRAAKNINSLDNQTMVPTATMFGRLVRTGYAACVAALMALIIPDFCLSADFQGPSRRGLLGESDHAELDEFFLVGSGWWIARLLP